MVTKTEYRAYIQSEAWQKRRKQFLLDKWTCEYCRIPRFFAVIAYDQDFHVHHRNYQNVGCELDSDLHALCRRCHEIETFGKSDIPKAGPAQYSGPAIKAFISSQSEVWLDGFNAATELWLYFDSVSEGSKQAVGA